jgi:hypothetical protein
MFTTLQLYYLRLSDTDKKQFKEKVMKETGCGSTTFYRHLKNVPPLLVQQFLSKETKIAASKLYETIDPLNPKTPII